MTCIEIYQDGVVPWSHILANQEVMDLVKAGKRHPKLRVLSPETYAKLNECWATDPKARPSFEDMRDYFKADLVRLTMASPQASSVITALDAGRVSAGEAVVDQRVLGLEAVAASPGHVPSSWWGCCGGGSKSSNAGGETEFGVPEPNKDENGFVDDGRGVFTFEMPD